MPRLQVRVDGTVLRTLADSTATERAYVGRTVDVSTFANGARDAVSFVYSNPSGGGTSNFTVDDATLECTASGN